MSDNIDATHALELGFHVYNTDNPPPPYDSDSDCEVIDAMITPPIKRSCTAKIIDPGDDSYWSHKQLSAMNAVMKGENILITGAAGTGKTALLKEAVSRLHKKHGNDVVFVTAMTGIASLPINGSTLHWFAGVELGNGTVNQLIAKIYKNPRRLDRWNAAKVIIIDEISMLQKQLFDKLEEIARRMKKCTKPFGGIQIIASGDFYQLPPFGEGPDVRNTVKDANYVKPNDFVFAANSWKNVIKRIVSLDIVYRQQADMPFVEMLGRIRVGKHTDADIAKLEERIISEDNPVDVSKMTSLYSRRADMESQNARHLKCISGEEYLFNAVDNCDYTQEGREALARLQKDCTATAHVVLKVGAFIVLLRNIEPVVGLVNGSRGTIVAIHNNLVFHDAKPAKTKISKEEGAETIVEESPDTIKSFSIQNPSFTDEHGMVFAQAGQKAVTVKFENGILATIGPQRWSIEKNLGENNSTEIASRIQIPFSLAWALTIHKSQGMTLATVAVSLNRIFAEGQGYVALGRVESLAGLYIIGMFDRKVICANPYVEEFYAGLEE